MHFNLSFENDKQCLLVKNNKQTGESASQVEVASPNRKTPL